VACDFAARYSAAGERLRPLCNGFDFKSRGWGGDFSYDTFMLSRGPGGLIEVADSASSYEIIRGMSGVGNLMPFIESFFEWLNEAKRVYGYRFCKE
jgi:hypothetical protein